MKMYDKISSNIIRVQTTTDKTTDKKESIISLLANTKEAINVSYGIK